METDTALQGNILYFSVQLYAEKTCTDSHRAEYSLAVLRVQAINIRRSSMQETDYPEFAELMSSTYDIFEQSISDNAIRHFFEALSRYDPEEINDAVMEHCATSMFAPSLNDIRRYFQNKDREQEERLRMTAIMEFRHFINSYDSGCDVIFADVHAAYAATHMFARAIEWNRTDIPDSELEELWVNNYLLSLRYRTDDSADSNHFLPGMYAGTDTPRVRFQGNYARCRAIAERLYAGRHPSFPAVPSALRSH